jgi:RNA-binding protein Luc7-like 2
MRAMLDELMGKERDVPLDRRTNKVIKFNDSSVCKHQLAGLCPNTLFRNTRSDLGGPSLCLFHLLLPINTGA